MVCYLYMTEGGLQVELRCCAADECQYIAYGFILDGSVRVAEVRVEGSGVVDDPELTCCGMYGHEDG